MKLTVRHYLICSLSAIIMASILTFIAVRFLTDNSILSLLLATYGGYSPSHDDVFFPFIIFYIPTALGVCLFGSHLFSDYSIINVYAFTRSYSKNIWYGKKFKQIALLVFLFTNVAYLATTIIGLIANYVCTIGQIILIWLSLNSTNFLSILLIVWVCNIISVKVDIKISIFLTTALGLMVFYIGFIEIIKPYWLNIINHIILARHDVSFISIEMRQLVIHNFELYPSVLLLGTLLMAVFYIGKYVVGNLELYSKE